MLSFFKRGLLLATILFALSATQLLAGAPASGPYKAGGISFEVPKGWTKKEPLSSMRLFQFEAASSSASGPAVMAVFYFGPGQGGAIDANIERWKSQFTAGENDAAPQISESKINDLKVTTVYLEGSYNGGMGFGGPQSDYAALGAIAEGNEGPVFFKMTGPKSSIQAVRSEFESFVQTMKA